jgi:hypothetical protein
LFLSEWREFPSALYLAGKKINLLIDRVSMFVEIARVPDMLPNLLPTWLGLEHVSTPVDNQQSSRRPRKPNIDRAL